MVVAALADYLNAVSQRFTMRAAEFFFFRRNATTDRVSALLHFAH
jgi:hypothetical protein